jgi:hypothetical protein
VHLSLVIATAQQTAQAETEVGRSDAPVKRLLRAVVPTSARAQLRIAQWRLRGSPVPPPHYVKQRALRDAAGEYGLKRLIETGTFLGDMLVAMRNDFDNLTSIELSDELYERATRRFAEDPKITLLHGDSSERIKEVAASIEEPALFWLDAHYSGSWHEDFDETAGSDRPNPIYAELEAVFASPYRHVVFIDDARLFNGEEGWPPLGEVRSFIEEHEPDRTLVVTEDCIRVFPT